MVLGLAFFKPAAGKAFDNLFLEHEKENEDGGDADECPSHLSVLLTGESTLKHCDDERQGVFFLVLQDDEGAEEAVPTAEECEDSEGCEEGF